MPDTVCGTTKAKEKIEELEKELRETKDALYKESSENRELRGKVVDLQMEKDRLMDIIKNLSVGFANIGCEAKK